MNGREEEGWKAKYLMLLDVLVLTDVDTLVDTLVLTEVLELT